MTGDRSEAPRDASGGRLFRRKRPPAGSPPGAVAHSADLPTPRLGVLAFDQQTLVEKHGSNLHDVAEALHGSRVVWLDVQGLSEPTTIRAIGERFGLHRLIFADILNLGQRPKLETYGDLVFCAAKPVSLRAAQQFGYPLFWLVCIATAVTLLVVFRRIGLAREPARGGSQRRRCESARLRRSGLSSERPERHNRGARPRHPRSSA